MLARLAYLPLPKRRVTLRAVQSNEGTTHAERCAARCAAATGDVTALVALPARQGDSESGSGCHHSQLPGLWPVLGIAPERIPHRESLRRPALSTGFRRRVATVRSGGELVLPLPARRGNDEHGGSLGPRRSGRPDPRASRTMPVRRHAVPSPAMG